MGASDGVLNYQPHHCLLNRLFRRRSTKTSKLRITGLCAGNSPETGEFPARMASYAERVSIWWRHHVTSLIQGPLYIWYIEYVCSVNRVHNSWDVFCLPISNRFATTSKVLSYGDLSILIQKPIYIYINIYTCILSIWSFFMIATTPDYVPSTLHRYQDHVSNTLHRYYQSYVLNILHRYYHDYVCV